MGRGRLRRIGSWFALVLSIVVGASAGGLRAQEAGPIRKARLEAESAAPGSEARFSALLGEARVLYGYDLRRAADVAEDARELASDRGDAAGVLRAGILLARIEARRRGREPADAMLAELLPQVPDDLSPDVCGEIEFDVANIDYAFDRISDCTVRLRRALSCFEKAGDVRNLVVCRLMVGGVLGSFERPFPTLEELLVQSQESGAKLASLVIRIHLIQERWKTGRISDAEAYDGLRQELVEARRLGGRQAESQLLSLLAIGEMDNENLERAEALTRQSVEVARSLGDREVLAMALQERCGVLRAAGRLSEARQAIDEALRILQGTGMDARRIDLLETAGSLATEAGEAERARECGLQRDAILADLEDRNPRDERARFWRESEKLRSRFERQRAELEAEIAKRDSYYAKLAWGGLALVLAIVTLSLGMTWRAKRRADRINARLLEEIATSKAIRDESEALEQNLRQLERIDSLGMMAGGFAHDFNNILTGVLGSAQLQLQRDDLDQETRIAFEGVVESGKRAAALCRDILVYASGGDGGDELVDLRDVLEDLLPIAKAGFGSGIEIAFDPGGEPRVVRGDRVQLEQLFLNILLNAGDAISDHGHVQVTLSASLLEGTPPSGNWFGEFGGSRRDCAVVRIRDDGRGMSPETVRRVFDPFFTTHFPGRGIGLAAAFGILRRHRGVVHVVSEPGRGTTFTVYLPRVGAKVQGEDGSGATREERVVELRPLPPRRPGGGGLALLVDDEADVLSIVGQMLEIDGYRVVTAANVDQALGKLDQCGPDLALALIDFTMPGADGGTLARILRERFPKLPILIMSGHDPSMVHCAAPGVGFLPKPIELSALRAAIGGASTEPSDVS